ncbi:MAG: hypothetical protein R3F02_01785 [Thiolinea sp.]
MLLVLLGACNSPPPSPVNVCQSVTEALLGFELPRSEQMNISEQEIRGERIVTHLKFARPADNYPVHAVCVFAANVYASSAANGQQPYSQVPTRMAINSQQVTEADLNAAILKAGFELD